MRPECNHTCPHRLKFESERRHDRHCEEQRDEAIQTVAAEKVWIASAYALWASADRSLALAMTGREWRMDAMRKLPVVPG